VVHVKEPRLNITGNQEQYAYAA